MLETGPDGGALAGVLQVPDTTDSGIPGMLGLDTGPSIIRAGIIHQDKFKGAASRGQGSQDFLGQEADVLRFVKYRDDNG